MTVGGCTCGNKSCRWCGNGYDPLNASCPNCASRLLENGQLRKDLAEAQERVRELEGQAPTSWAYEQACKALEKHRKRAEIARAGLKRAAPNHHQDITGKCIPDCPCCIATETLKRMEE